MTASVYRKQAQRFLTLLPISFLLIASLSCQQPAASPEAQKNTQVATADGPNTGSPLHLALWLAKKDELLAHQAASYDLVMTGWFEPAEAQSLRSRTPTTKLLAGLTHTWVLDDPGWQQLLITIANGGDLHGPQQITEDMYLMLDEGRCSLPGWENLYAMDPRHPGWRQLVVQFYSTVAAQPQHDGVIVDMVDAYPFCQGAWSGGVPTPIDESAWVQAQAELLGLIREEIPAKKWLIANAGRSFQAGSPFEKYLNGYLLENFLGEWGAGLEEGLAAAQRALETTNAPHIVVFAVDTDDSGVIDWARFQVGMAASLLLDHTYFAFDYGSRDHGGVKDWWFPAYYNLDLGAALGLYEFAGGVYQRDFEKGRVVIAASQSALVKFDRPHIDTYSNETSLEFNLPVGNARIYLLATGQ